MLIVAVIIVLLFLDKIAVYGFWILAKTITTIQIKKAEIKRINSLYIRNLENKTKKNKH